MSIEVKNLKKIYGSQTALNDLSFKIEKGEIVGFLGPNGAGKSTTMKIICGYLPPTEGQAFVCGIPVAENAIETKAKVGYLPEHNPLYLDMFVAEFLNFVASVNKVKNKKERIEKVISTTGLSPERHKKIGQLSKGYRQRVGIAQALIHDPEVLILDEPTSGLDPNQVQEIRNLILTISKDKTIMLSTHIMQEVEAMCSRVIILDKGVIKADDKVEKVKSDVGSKSSKVFTVAFRDSVNIQDLEALKSISKVEALGGNKFKLIGNESADLAEIIFGFAVESKNIILEQKEDSQTLESVFQKLTRSKDV